MSDTLHLEFVVPDTELAREFAAWAPGEEGLVDDLEVSKAKGIDPLVTPIIFAAVVTIAGLAKIIDWIRRRTQCQVILDARNADEVKKTVDCSIRDGRLIIVTAGDERVEVVDVPELFDFGLLITAALGGSAKGVVAAARAAGATVKES